MRFTEQFTASLDGVNYIFYKFPPGEATGRKETESYLLSE